MAYNNLSVGAVVVGNSAGTASFTVNCGTGGANFGTSANAHTTTIGSGTTTSTTTIDCGTGGANFGTTANAHTTTIGSTNSTSATTVQSGSGALAVTSTNGTLTINSGTGALAISNDASATTISIGTGAAVKTVTVGSTNTTSATVIQAGSGGVKLGTPKYPTASATSRKIIVSDGTDFTASTETWAVPGTAGNLLRSDGTNWTSAAAAGVGGSLVLLSSQNASGASSTNFTSLLTSTYTKYLLIFDNVSGAGGMGTLQMKLSANNGSSYLAANYLSGLTYNSYNAATWTNLTSTVVINLITGTVTAGSGYVWMYNMTRAAVPFITGQSIANGAMQQIQSSNSTTTINAFQIIPDAGTFSGTFTLYGLATA